MRRSYSQGYITGCIDREKKKPEQNFELSGKMVKKVADQRSAQWNGVVLGGPSSKKTVKKSPMRWGENLSSKRTVNPELNLEKSAVQSRRRTSASSCSNLTEMISKGYSEEKIGKLNKKVVLNGMQVTKNAVSFENHLNSKGLAAAYNGLHTGQVPAQEKRHIVITEFSKSRKTSQIYTLPGGPKEPQAQVPGREGFESKIIETSNPCMRKRRNTDLTLDKEKLITSFASHYDKFPLGFDLTPSKQGKMRDSKAFERMYKGASPERELVSPRKKRPENVTDAFRSSIILF